MKKTAKLLAMALVVVLAASLFGCNNSNASTVKINELKDLGGLKISVQEGTTGDTIATHGGAKQNEDESYGDPVFEATIARFKTFTDAALEVKNGKADCMIIDSIPGQKIIDKNNDLKILSDVKFEDEQYAIAVGKNNSELLESINATLKKLRDNGTYDKMISYYIDGDTSVELPKIEEASGDKVITMGTNASFEPFEYHDDNNDIVGFDIYLSQQIAADFGAKLKVEDMNFDSLTGAVQTGKIDFVAAGMTANDERRKSVDFSDSYYNATQVIIVKK